MNTFSLFSLASVNDSEGRRYASHYTDLNKLRPVKDNQLKGLKPLQGCLEPPVLSTPTPSQPIVTDLDRDELTDGSPLDLEGQSVLHARRRGLKAESQRRRRQLKRQVKREERREREGHFEAHAAISDHIGDHDWTPRDSSSASKKRSINVDVPSTLDSAAPSSSINCSTGTTTQSKDKGKRRKVEPVEPPPTFPASSNTSLGSISSQGHEIALPQMKNQGAKTTVSSSSPDQQCASMESSATIKPVKGDMLQKQFRKAFQPVSMTAGTIEECLYRSTKMTKQENKTLAQTIDNNVTYLNDIRSFGFMALQLLVMSELGHVSPDTRDDEFSTDGVQQHLHPLNLVLDTVHGFTIIRHILRFLMDGKLSTIGRQPKPENKAINEQCRKLAERAYNLLTLQPSPETGEQLQNTRVILPMTTKAHASSLSHLKDQMASEMMTAVRQHFKKLPNTIKGLVSVKILE